MRVDLPAGPSWTSVSDRYRRHLPFQDEKVQVRVYAGFRHALFEATQGLARLFSHKKTIAVVGRAEPALTDLLVGFSQEGFVLKTIEDQDLADFDTWFQPLSNDLLFVLYANDDPITGRIYDRTILNARLSDKRVFRIGVSHAVSHLATTPPILERPQPFEVKVLSLAPDRALIVAGERFRANPVLADRLPWLSENIEWRIASAVEVQAAEKAVTAFESSLPKGFLPYFAADDRARVFDRAVLYHPELDGSALIDELCLQKSDFKFAAAGSSSDFETTSPCRWPNPRVLEWLLARGDSEETVRGLIIINYSLLNSDLKNLMAAAAEKILAMQKG